MFESYMTTRTGRSYQPVKMMEKDITVEDGVKIGDRMSGNHSVTTSVLLQYCQTKLGR